MGSGLSPTTWRVHGPAPVVGAIAKAAAATGPKSGVRAVPTLPHSPQSWASAGSAGGHGVCQDQDSESISDPLLPRSPSSKLFTFSGLCLSFWMRSVFQFNRKWPILHSGRNTQVAPQGVELQRQRPAHQRALEGPWCGLPGASVASKTAARPSAAGAPSHPKGPQAPLAARAVWGFRHTPEGRGTALPSCRPMAAPRTTKTSWPPHPGRSPQAPGAGAVGFSVDLT